MRRVFIAIVSGFFMLFAFTQCGENLADTERNEINLSAISEGLNALLIDGEPSMENVSDHFSTMYGVDLHAEFQKIEASFISDQSKSNAKTAEIDLYNFQATLDNVGISEGSYSYDYFTQLSGIFENGIYEEWEIETMINNMRNEISNNYLLSSYERNNLLMAWDALIINYDGLINASYSIYDGSVYATAKTKGWFRTAWRVVRSVILTAGVGFAVGFIASGGNPIGGIVGAVINGGAATADAIFNDYCHFAMQCDGGWRQECSTGYCAPY